MNPYLAAALLLALWFLLFRWLVRYWQRTKTVPKKTPLCKGSHFMRPIAAPFAQQCRKCGAVVFRTDEKGNFPDELPGYFEYVERWEQERAEKSIPGVIERPPGWCHCGAQMVVRQDVVLGEIWLCEICNSWRKTPKQDRLDTESLINAQRESLPERWNRAKGEKT